MERIELARQEFTEGCTFAHQLMEAEREKEACEFLKYYLNELATNGSPRQTIKELYKIFKEQSKKEKK